MWVSPLVRRSVVKRWLSHLYRAVLPGLCLSFGQIIWFLLPDLPWDTLLGVHAPLSHSGSWSEGFWEEQYSSWSGVIPWILTHKKPFCACVVPPLSQKRGEGDPLILYSNRVLCFFVLTMTITLTSAMTITWRGYKRQGLAIYPVSVVTSILESKKETDCPCLSWSPPISCLRKC